MIRRRSFITLLGGAAVWPLAARAQQPALPLVGYLYPGDPDADADTSATFRNGLREAGYIEGQNVTIEYGWAHNDVDNRLPSLINACLSGSLPLMMPGGSNHRCRDFYTWELRRGQPIQERS